jgi:hypothetical protein
MRPCYANTRLDPYRDLDCLGADEAHDPLHYAPSLVQRINATAGQEIASHTFSHYYCLEQGQTVETFREDLRAARRVAADQRISLSSLVLPRNQLNAAYLGVCKELGFRCYRGHANSWVYAPRREHDESLPYRGMRLIDSYLNLTGHHCYPISLQDDNLPINLPASRFLRPYPACVQLFEMLRLQRILADLTWAAEHRQVYHLWWHPHNFGKRQAQNLAFLRVILRHFTTLRDQFGMESATMGETAALLLERANPCTKCSTAPYRAPQDVY